MGIIRYYRALAKAKVNHEYQGLTFSLFRKALPFTREKFIWSDDPPDSWWHMDGSLLWYVSKEPCRPPFSGYHVHTYVVDLPYWKAVLFRLYTNRLDKKEKRIARKSLTISNESNAILMDIQSTIQHQIDVNDGMIRQELLNLRRKTAQLTPFEEDYLKAQIRVEV